MVDLASKFFKDSGIMIISHSQEIKELIPSTSTLIYLNQTFVKLKVIHKRSYMDYLNPHANYGSIRHNLRRLVSSTDVAQVGKLKI